MPRGVCSLEHIAGIREIGLYKHHHIEITMDSIAKKYMFPYLIYGKKDAVRQDKKVYIIYISWTPMNLLELPE